MKNADTIFAAASGTGKAAVRIFRISGAETHTVSRLLSLEPLPPRVACLRSVRDPRSGEAVDAGLAIWFPAPASFTGEDCLELHLHGGRAIERAISGILSELPGCRLAEAGEFAWRAFLNGKMDLTEVEGLADLIDAETELQRRQALGQNNGRLLRTAQSWRGALISCLALVEGEIDFEDEADVPKDVMNEVLSLVSEVRRDLRSAIEDFSRAELTRDGFCVVILGPPNAGKSSLLNYLADREAAIVSARPGTTRDLIEVSLDLDGASIVLVDTAGLQSSDDEIEQIGIRKARERAERANLVLWLTPDGSDEFGPHGIGDKESVVVIHSKCDLSKARSQKLAVSTFTGEGVKELLALISERAHASLQAENPALLTRKRHLSLASSALVELEAVLPSRHDLEVVAERLRQASRSLEALFGRIDSEEILGDIFSRFCVGK
jgi:tRNA modification GTPase